MSLKQEESGKETFVTTNGTLKECNLSLLKNGTFSDVTFIIGSLKKAIPCHKLILMARSPVFTSMFSPEEEGNRVKEEYPNGVDDRTFTGNVVQLPEFEPGHFLTFLKFVYADCQMVNLADAVEVLPIAQKFQVTRLVSDCNDMLKNEMKLEWCVRIYKVATKFQFTELQNTAMDMMIRKFGHLINHSSFLDMDEEMLVNILQKNDLTVNEIDIFHACSQWATIQLCCQVSQIDTGKIKENPDILGARKLLDRILPLVRFPLLTGPIFGSVVVPSQIVPSEDVINILTYFTADEKNKKLLEKSLKYSIIPRLPVTLTRECLYEEEQHSEITSWNIKWVNRTEYEETLSFIYTKNPDSTHPARLHYIIVSCPEVDNQKDLKVFVSIQKDSKEMFNGSTIIQSCNKMKVKVAPPIILQDGKYYVTVGYCVENNSDAFLVPMAKFLPDEDSTPLVETQDPSHIVCPMTLLPLKSSFSADGCNGEFSQIQLERTKDGKSFNSTGTTLLHTILFLGLSPGSSGV